MYLEKINSVQDLRKIKQGDLAGLSDEIRELIIDVISKNGGHLASSLGAVELAIALHYVFNTPTDRLIWDVGHQTYAHKIITGRRKDFPTIRKFGGISGFPKRKESVFDTYNTGHSSTSLSLAFGEAVSRDLRGKEYKVIAVIGDGSLTGGMAWEALNHIGQSSRDLIIILNDNEHSISKNVGAISRYLIRIITGSLYNKFRRKSMELIRKIPRIGNSIFNFLYRFFESFKGMLVPGHLFEEIGVRYFGPVDGHNIEMLIDVLHKVKEINYGPRLIHVLTKKGKGYPPAEADPAKFHGIGPFDPHSGSEIHNDHGMTYSELAGRTLAAMSERDRRIVAITAAMKLGTGLFEFERVSPERFFDAGIAEQHSITFACALAASGMKPFVSIYSTFLQRAVDQLIHDAGLMNLPVKFLIDRSGVVGEDGETHHGLFDIGFIRNIPNFIFLAPSNGKDLKSMIYFAAHYDRGPVAIRYPRGTIKGDVESDRFTEFSPGKIRVLSSGKDLAVFALGDMVDVALELGEILKGYGLSTAVVDLISIKPMDIAGIEKVIKKTGSFITLENSLISGGAGEYLLSLIASELKSKILFCAGFPDEIISHGSVRQLFQKYGIDAETLAKRIMKKITA